LLIRRDEGNATSWEELSLAGKALERIDEDRIENFYFGSQGTVSAEVGVKGGSVAGPSWFWRIEQDRLIISEAPGGSAELQMYRPKISANVLTVQRNLLQSARYRLKKQ